MNRGAKRAAFSDSAIDPTDFHLRSKRVTEASSFDGHMANSSHHNVREGQPLEVQRANLSLQHVRALNTQFASWVQSQLQNHLDDLWINGVKDYLSHASNILDEFKDVVEWLRENATKSQSNLSTSSPSGAAKPAITSPAKLESLIAVVPPNFSLQKSVGKPASVSLSDQSNTKTEAIPSSDRNLASDKMVVPSTVPVSQMPSLFFSTQTRLSSDMNNELSKEAPSTSFPFMQNSSLNSSSQSGESFPTSGTKLPIFSGGQISAPHKVETGDADEGELEQPSSPSLKKIEERGVSIVHEVKCKVYIKQDSPAENRWKDMGTGQLSIKCKEGVEKATKESKPTVIVRNDIGRILLNALIYPGIKMSIQKTSIVSIFHTAAGGEQGDSSQVVARTYLLRLKSLEEATKLAETIKEYAPSA